MAKSKGDGRSGAWARAWAFIRSLFAPAANRTGVIAGEAVVWPVRGTLLAKATKHGKQKKAKDISGLACSREAGFPRIGMVVCDEVQFAQFVTVHDGEIVAGATVALIDDTFDGKPLEFDGEGVAYAGGCFYVVGSHGHPRDEKNELHPVRDRARIDALIAANSRLFRVAIDPTTGEAVDEPVRQSTLLTALIAADATLGPFQHKRLDANGVTVEGIAILGDRLYVGFRGPSLGGNRAAILSAALDAFFDNEPAAPTLHVLPLGAGRGVRDLAIYEGGLLILAGPTAEEGGTYSIYWWDSVGTDVTLLDDLAPYTDDDGDPIKPETIMPLDRDGNGLRVLIMFDGAKEGGPRAVVVRNPR